MTDKSKITPFFYSLSGDTEEDNKKLLEPFKHILQCFETHISTKFTPAFNYYLKISPNKLQQIDEIIRSICAVSLLFDDIQDNSMWRDDIPVAHSIYGLPNTINAANYAQVIVFEKIINLHPAAVKILIECLLELNKGQGMDMYWKDNFICPNEKDYEIMAIRKTSWALNLAVKLMKLFSINEDDYSVLISLLGLYYNIYTDYCNFCKELNDKSYCDDITEGKFNFVIVHAITRNPGDKQIINILRQRTTDISMKHYCVKLLEKFGSFKYTREVLEKLNTKLRNKVERLGGNPILIQILNEFETNMPNPHI